MYAQVKLLNGYKEPLWYHIPDEWAAEVEIGTAIQVPLRGKEVSGIVVKEQHQKPAIHFTIKDALQLEPFPLDHTYQKFIKNLSIYHQISSIELLKRIRGFIEKKRISKNKTSPHEPSNKETVVLTTAQQAIIESIKNSIDIKSYAPILLHGVTGSGKTEIYKEIIKKTIAQKKSVIFLLPEVSLAAAFELRLTKELPTVSIMGFHSSSPSAQKRLVWQQLIIQQPLVIVGVHQPVLLPCANLGLIIVDEEHEIGYQEKKHPKINSKEAALLRASYYNIPIILGSATPSLQSMHLMREKNWEFYQLKDRYAGSFPRIDIVYLPKKDKRPEFWISRELQQAIQERLEKNEQTILFINRRGFAFFIQCQSCAYIFRCQHCSVSLTLHEKKQLACHYCGRSMGVPLECPQCKAKAHEFLNKGIGTQQAAYLIAKLFPQARIARADKDITSKKKLWKETLNKFSKGELDILIGTQTITKGYDFKNVTLVGILWADLQLNIPFFNSAETCLQQLLQVAGRAGRHHTESQVIVQTMVHHEIFNYLNEIDYLKFYEYEMESRRSACYPPVTRFAEIELRNRDELILNREAQILCSTLKSEQIARACSILGPAKPPVFKINNWFSLKLYIKGNNINDVIALVKNINKTDYESIITFTPHPLR